MNKYALNPDLRKSARVYGRSLRISTKSSKIVCKAITGKNLDKGRKLLEGMASQERDLEGKYYSNTTREILNLLKSAEANAEFKGLDLSRTIIHASAHQGFAFMRPRRLKMRRTKRKITNIQMVLMEK